MFERSSPVLLKYLYDPQMDLSQWLSPAFTAEDLAIRATERCVQRRSYLLMEHNSNASYSLNNLTYNNCYMDWDSWILY